MTKIIAIVLAFVAYSGFVWWAGYGTRDAQAKQEAAIAKSNFDKLLDGAAKAYANQKVEDDKELAALKELAEQAPANPTIAIKKDMASRIGAIR